MKKKVFNYLEKNKKIRIIETSLMVILFVFSFVLTINGLSKINTKVSEISYRNQYTMIRNEELEDYSEDNKSCDVVYEYENKSITITYTYQEYQQLQQSSIIVYEYQSEEGLLLYFDHSSPTSQEIEYVAHQTLANQVSFTFNLAISLFILLVSFGVIFFFGKCFTTYEKCWFISIMILATLFANLFPEESANGVNGIIIMLLYLMDTFLNILCELLISKQSRYNFLVSVAVEITEILICIVLMYRFSTLTVTLFFWLPIDIISFINWSKHKDEQESELTIVRRLKGYQEVLILIGIAVWTIVVGYLISGLNITTDFINNHELETFIIYLDACASAVGIANGLFIFFRLREQWIAWYICALLETIMNILSGQYVLLILKLGYFTNTTYGYIKWSKYIKSHQDTKVIETEQLN